MPLPDELQNAIEEETRSFKGTGLADAYEELSAKYRDSSQRNSLASAGKQFMGSSGQRAAYIAARMPATFSVLRRVFQEIQKGMLETLLSSLLDLGCGPGTAMWAAADLFPDLQSIHLFEQDEQMISVGKRLARFSPHHAVQQSVWEKGNLAEPPQWTPHDLVVLSYVLGELSVKHYAALFESCWITTQKVLIFVEPGTPDGFERIRTIRNLGIELGAQIIAPCPDSMNCPMQGGDWCHFSERVERTSSHRQMKKGTLGHEDEKFSYIAFGKCQADLPHGRVIRHPGKHSGHVTLQLCTSEGLKNETVSKREGPMYKLARKVEWGDEWPSRSDPTADTNLVE
jgi:ribosomal protein RSM22 (predicted rRNA methylase)